MRAKLFKPLPDQGLLGLAWPASPASEEELAPGLRVLEKLGYRTAWQPAAAGPMPYLAGQDEARAAELSRLMADPQVDGVICGRGGYGSLRTAARLDFEALAAAAKPLVGFSDVTVLLSGLLGRGGTAVHGPTVTNLADQSPASLARLASILGGGWPRVKPLAGRPLSGRGRVRGFLAGGNLTILAHLAGTPWQPPTAGAIVFFEDKGEVLYRLDRCLSHLLAAGFFENCQGVAVGRLDGVDYPQALAMISHRLEALGLPLVAGLEFGHGPNNNALLVGGLAELDAEEGWLRPLDQEAAPADD
ncbi:MAG: LD-carboxypeptidase [Deltaproteobacteria bacterium]|nr:LD-carboxypeptidase [Deltaproteobacteria bacterium]